MSKKSGEMKIATKLDRAKQLKEQGKFDEALPLLVDIVEASPDLVQALMLLISIHEDCQEWKQVATYCQRVIDAQPKRIGVYFKLAKALQKQGDIHGAIAAYQKAIELKPDQQANTYANLGNALAEVDRIDEAVDAYRHSLKRKSEQPHLHLKLGDLMGKRGQLGVAAEYYQQAFTLKPEWGEKIQMKLADVRMQQGQLDGAISHYQTALRINPNLATAYQGLGDAFQQKGLSDDALENYKKSHKLKPNPTLKKAIEAATPKPVSEPEILEEFTTQSEEPTGDVPDAALATKGKGSAEGSGPIMGKKFGKMGKFQLKGRPKPVDQKQLEGKEAFPTVDIQWNRTSLIFWSLFLGGLYIAGLMSALSSGVKAIIIAMTAGPILLGAFIGLLYFINRNL